MNNHRLKLIPVRSFPRSITNSANQVIEQLAYFNVTGLTYSATNAWMGTASNTSASGNYHSTKYKTSARGWPERVLDPTGTITRNVTDGLGRVLSVWTGTDDTPNSGFWSPTNTAGTDLVTGSAGESQTRSYLGESGEKRGASSPG